MSEVDIKENTSDNLLDRDVQIITDKMRIGSANTNDILEKISGVNIDKFSNSIKVDNKDNIIILVDGIKRDQEYISSISPDRLLKVEVIRDPGGRYSLEGYSAVINVILKKDYQGTEFFFIDRTMSDPDASISKYFFPKNYITSSLSYSRNKLNIYAKYRNSYSNINLPSSNKKEYTNGLIIEKKMAENNAVNSHSLEMTNKYTLGADLYINPRQILSYEGHLSSSPLGMSSNSELYDVVYTLNGEVQDNYKIKSQITTPNQKTYNSFIYDVKLSKNDNVNTSFTYYTYNDKGLNTFSENSIIKSIEEGESKKQNTAFYLEYMHIFNEKSNIEVGYGNSYEKLKSSFTTNATSTEFEYSDFRNKLYSYYSLQINKKLGVKIGGAGETSTPKAYEQKKSYFILQPFANIHYRPLKFLDLNAKYRVESNYPNIAQTNPFSTAIDQQSVRVGNPYLSPNTIQKSSLVINLFHSKLTIEPYYSFSNNYIATIGRLNENNIFEYSYLNVGEYSDYGVLAGTEFQIGKSFYVSSSIDIYKTSLSFENKINSFNEWSMTNQITYVNKKYGTVAGFEFKKNLCKSIIAQGYEMSDIDYWLIYVQHPFFKEKLSISLAYFLPINFGNNFNKVNYIETETFKESSLQNMKIIKNVLAVQISYRFSKGKPIKKVSKEIRIENERKSGEISL